MSVAQARSVLPLCLLVLPPPPQTAPFQMLPSSVAGRIRKLYPPPQSSPRLNSRALHQRRASPACVHSPPLQSRFSARSPGRTQVLVRQPRSASAALAAGAAQALAAMVQRGPAPLACAAAAALCNLAAACPSEMQVPLHGSIDRTPV